MSTKTILKAALACVVALFSLIGCEKIGEEVGSSMTWITGSYTINVDSTFIVINQRDTIYLPIKEPIEVPVGFEGWIAAQNSYPFGPQKAVCPWFFINKENKHTATSFAVVENPFSAKGGEQKVEELPSLADKEPIWEDKNVSYKFKYNDTEVFSSYKVNYLAEEVEFYCADADSSVYRMLPNEISVSSDVIYQKNDTTLVQRVNFYLDDTWQCSAEYTFLTSSPTPAPEPEIIRDTTYSSAVPVSATQAKTVRTITANGQLESSKDIFVPYAVKFECGEKETISNMSLLDYGKAVAAKTGVNTVAMNIHEFSATVEIPSTLTFSDEGKQITVNFAYTNLAIESNGAITRTDNSNDKFELVNNTAYFKVVLDGFSVATDTKEIEQKKEKPALPTYPGYKPSERYSSFAAVTDVYTRNNERAYTVFSFIIENINDPNDLVFKSIDINSGAEVVSTTISETNLETGNVFLSLYNNGTEFVAGILYAKGLQVDKVPSSNDWNYYAWATTTNNQKISVVSIVNTGARGPLRETASYANGVLSAAGIVIR